MNIFPISGWRQWLPCSITLAALIAGFVSIVMTMEGFATNQSGPILLASLLIMLAWILDAFDGTVARWVKGTSSFGAELDTFVDFLAFSVAPALLVFAVTLGGQPLAVRALFPTLMVISGAMRLSKFRVIDTERGLKGYTGLPVTLIAGFLSFWVFLLLPAQDINLANWAQVVLLICVIAAVILQVSGIHYPAPTKKPAIMILCVFLTVVLVILWWFDSPITIWWGMGLILIGFGYSLIYPFFSKK